MSIWCKIQDRLTYVRIIALGYLVVIITGTLFLLLPAATVQGKQTDFLTALFTATTSTCVTGLVVVDTGTHWTVFGQTVILLMVQVGELGFMTMGMLLAMLLKKKITLRARGLLQESMNGMQVGGILHLVRLALVGTAIVELVGAVLFFIRFIPKFGIGRGIYYSIFHSISTFCNAGIDPFGAHYGEYTSLVPFRNDVFVNIVTMVLIMIGGIGFFV